MLKQPVIERGLWPQLQAPRFGDFGVALAVATVYFLLAKLGLKLASLNPSSSPVWPPTGFALAMVLLLGNRVWPGVLAGALIANATTAGSLATSLAIALGNTLEAVVGGWFVERWCGGTRAFDSSGKVAKFALISIGPGTLISATIGVSSLWLGGFIGAGHFSSVWTTWWMGDAASALLLTPVIVLWVDKGRWPLHRNDLLEALLLLAAACGIGLVVFSPHTVALAKAPMSFLAMVPLLWAGLRRGPRDTSTVALVLAGFAVWGAAAGQGSFADPGSPDNSFLLVTMFIIGAALPSLALSAEVALHRQAEALLRIRQQDLDSAQAVAHTGSWRLDLNHNALSWSAETHRIFGLPEGTPMTYEEFLDIVHPDDRADVDRQWKAAVKGAPYDIEHRIVVDGAVQWVRERAKLEYDATGKLLGGFGTTQDVTDKKKAEEALRRRELLLRLATDNAAVGLVVLDCNRRYTFVNRPYVQILGLPQSAEQLIGKGPADILSSVYATQIAPCLDRAFAGERVACELARPQESNGEPRHYTVVYDPIADSGTVRGVIVTIFDITERKRAEEALRESQVQLALDLNAMARLQKIGTLFIREGNFDPVLGEIVEAAIAISGADMGNIQLRDPTTGDLRIVAQRGFPQWWLDYWDVVTHGHGACGTALERGERVIVEDVENSPIFVGTPALDIQLRAGVRAVQSTPLVSRSGEKLGMFSTHYRTPQRPDERALQLLDLLARQAADIVERHRAEATKALLAAIVSSSSEAIISKTLDGTVTSWNAAAEHTYGYTVREMLGASIRRMVPSERQAEEDDFLARIRGGERIQNYETVRVRKDGRTVEVSVTFSPILDEAGNIIGVSKIAHDISERKRAEEQVKRLLREVNHRAKNLLGVVQAIAWHTTGADRDAFIDRFSARIHALATNHDLLVKSEWRGVELGDLVRSQLAHFEGLIGGRIRLEGPDLHITAEAAQPLAMALHELATNAGKYGALSNTLGGVCIAWAIDKDGAGTDRFRLSWSERGGPEVHAPSRRGFGTAVITEMPKMQLGAEVTLDYAPGGITWRLACPATKVRENDGRQAVVEDWTI